ncbi:unnamed protein product [Ceutorhynchus assimilis]|uniref:Uncharacterized protein n=1 Tax=Ceutorhynchus assimilis TaxID=467358 RepID=A0A9N9MFK6_9CUCU|nr:unnamed protein product [Ceutorhynchus assimilis]
MNQDSSGRRFNTESFRDQSPLKSPGLKLLQKFKQGNSLLSKTEKAESPIKEVTKFNSPMSIKNDPMSLAVEEDLELTDEYLCSWNGEYDHFGDAFDVEDFNFDIEDYSNYNTPPVSPIIQDSFEVSEMDYSTVDYSFEDVFYENQLSDN